MTFASAEAIEAAPRQRITWAGNLGGANNFPWVTPGNLGNVWNNPAPLSHGIPFDDAPTTAGYSPTSYTFGWDTVRALDYPARAIELHCDSRSRAVALFDLLWISKVTVVPTGTAEVISASALPARDVNGSSNGDGCQIAVWANNQNTTLTVTYTNSDGVTGRTATGLLGIGSTGGPVLPSLDTGDFGVRAIESFQSSAASDTTMRVGIVRKLFGVATVTDGDVLNANPPMRQEKIARRPQGHYAVPIPAGALLFPAVGLGNLSTNTMAITTLLALDV